MTLGFTFLSQAAAAAAPTPLQRPLTDLVLPRLERLQDRPLVPSPPAHGLGRRIEWRHDRARDGERRGPVGLDPAQERQHLVVVPLADGIGLVVVAASASDGDAEEALGRAHITVNKNAVPGDPRSPFITSGLRLGTPAITTRGYREPQAVALAHWICDVLDDPTNEGVLAGARDNVVRQCREYPVYGG